MPLNVEGNKHLIRVYLELSQLELKGIRISNGRALWSKVVRGNSRQGRANVSGHKTPGEK